MKWINVNDSLPERETQVLFMDVEGTMYVGQRCGCKECDSFHYNCPNSFDPNEIDSVTHWAYLPKKP